MVIGLVVLTIAFLIYRTAMPDVIEDQRSLEEDTESLLSKISGLLKEKQLMSGVLAEFFYVGAQAGILSFFIRFSEKIAGLAEKAASYYLTAALVGFMLGRFIGTFLMRFISPVKLLAVYSIMSVILLISAVVMQDKFSVFALMGVTFFMSIMFPTIFSLSIRGLGSRTKLGSSLVIMGIVGGAIIPPIMGRISDLTSIQYAYMVPVICFLNIFYFAWKNLKVRNLEAVAGH